MFGFWLGMFLIVCALIVYAVWSGKAGMQNEYRDRAEGLADLLRYATPVANGTVALKGGELLAGFFYRGTDTESASNTELESIAARLNQALKRFGDGYVVHVEAIRGTSIGYAEAGAFSSPVASMMDEERRLQYNREGNHFESQYALMITYLPPSRMESKARSMLYESTDDIIDTPDSLHNEIVRKFEQEIQEVGAQLSTVFDGISRMSCRTVVNEVDNSKTVVDDLLGFLHYCVTGIAQQIIAPKPGISLDAIIGSQDFFGGNEPRIGSKHIRVIGIEGFPAEGMPGMLGALNSLPISYRWSNRFIFMDPEEGKNILDKYRKKWKQKVRGLKDQTLNTSSGAVDEDSLAMTVDAQTAMSEAMSGLVRYGHYTSVVVLMDEDKKVVEQNKLECLKLIRNLGFTCRNEDVNAVEAYLGSLPGHGRENVRRPILHTLNFAHLIPTTAAWPGPAKNGCPFYPRNSPVIAYGATSGNAPFRLSLHVGDVGHTLILGPTGAGKSTLLEFLAAQHFRYKNAKVIKFEKGYSSFVVCNALGGSYYDIGGDNQDIAFCPLGQVHKRSERIWAEGYIETLLELQGFTVLPVHRTAIASAMEMLANSDADRRSMTDFCAAVQDQEIQEALRPYTLQGNNSMLDATEDDVRIARFQVYEMEHLMSMGTKHTVPVLLYLFRCVERQLDGSPVLLVLDEAWLMLSHPMFQEKIKEWLKVMRKANCAVIFASQSISDVGNSPIRDVIYESCATKILLPNTEARSNESCNSQYRLIGLNERQVDLLSFATYKRDYYYMSPMGRRMFRLGLGPVCLSFVGVSGKNDVVAARDLMQRHGEQWPAEWLRHVARTQAWGINLEPWAKELEKSYRLAA